MRFLGIIICMGSSCLANNFLKYWVLILEDGIIKINGLFNSTILSKIAGHIENGGLLTIISPKSFSKKSTSSWIVSNPNSVKYFPESPLPRRLWCHVVIMISKCFISKPCHCIINREKIACQIFFIINSK